MAGKAGFAASVIKILPRRAAKGAASVIFVGAVETRCGGGINWRA
jgi:hypothetical protein